jgi:dTDP-glucose pyrophosphorylase
MGYIDKVQLVSLGNEMSNNQYGQYLLKIAETE